MNKRKIIFVFIICFLTQLTLSAWEIKSDTTLFWGIRGGSSYARIIGYDGRNMPLLAYHGGILVFYQPKREYTLKTGINFVQKGFSHDLQYFTVSGLSAGYYKTAFRFDYLNIPLNFIYNFSSKRFNLFLVFGIDIDFLLKQKIFSNDVPNFFNNEIVVYTPAEGTEFYKKLNLSLSLGAGIEYRIKNNFIPFIELYYMHGITDSYNINNFIYFMKHRPILLSIGIRLGIPIKYSVSENFR